jgi:hypothetical protein
MRCSTCGHAKPNSAARAHPRELWEPILADCQILPRVRPLNERGSASARFTSPETYTPKHLAENILTSKAALEGERKQVTVSFRLYLLPADSRPAPAA